MNNAKFLSRALLSLALIAFFSTATQAQSKTSSSAHEISNDDLKEYVGQYDPEGGQFFSVTVSLDGDDRLMAQPTDKSEPLTLLSATEKDKFDLVGPPIQLAFQRDDKGKIISLTLSQGGNSFTALRVKD